MLNTREDRTFYNVEFNKVNFTEPTELRSLSVFVCLMPGPKEESDDGLDCAVCEEYFRVHHSESGHRQPERDCGLCEKTRGEHHSLHHSLCWNCNQDLTSKLRPLFWCKKCKFSTVILSFK